MLMAGLIAPRWYAIFAALRFPPMMAADVGHLSPAAAAEAERTLMRGLTTIRNPRRPGVCALKQAVDEA